MKANEGSREILQASSVVGGLTWGGCGCEQEVPPRNLLVADDRLFLLFLYKYGLEWCALPGDSFYKQFMQNPWQLRHCIGEFIQAFQLSRSGMSVLWLIKAIKPSLGG